MLADIAGGLFEIPLKAHERIVCTLVHHFKWHITSGNLTSRITGRGRRHGDQPLELRCPRSGACACWATPTYLHHLDAVEPLAIVTSKLQGDGAPPSGLPPRLGRRLDR